MAAPNDSQLTNADSKAIAEAIAIAHRVVWGVMTTVDAKGRPRNRVVHPVWTFANGSLEGWVTTRKTPLKTRHLAHNPHVSVAYVGANTDFAYFDCVAAWADAPAEREHAWDAFLAAPEPVRYDPASIWPGGPSSPDFAALRLRPYRVQAASAEAIGRGERAALVRIA